MGQHDKRNAIVLIVFFGGFFGCVAICCGLGAMTMPTEQQAERTRQWEELREEQREIEDAAKAEREASQAAQLTQKRKRAIEIMRARIGDNPAIHSVSQQSGVLYITVANDWHLVAYQIRLQAAQNIGALWKSLYPEGLGAMSIVDFNGNEVGGTGFTGIWVQEN